MSSAEGERRRRGSIRKRGNSLQVRVFAGQDPVTGRDLYLSETVRGTNRASEREADKVLTRLQNQADEQRAPSTGVSLEYVIDEWLKSIDVEPSTRQGYEGYIRRTIKPALGSVAASKIDVRTLEILYAELRRCRVRCDGKPYIEKHKRAGDHDCGTEKCRVHTCRPMESSTVRQIHTVISSALSAAERWGWINSNPARVVKRPRQKPPQPNPPSPDEAAKLVEEAFRMGEEWGTLVWLAMTTGMRRGELCALRWSCFDLERGILDLRRNYVDGREKDTKTHQIRRISLDPETVTLLKEHRDECRDQLAEIGLRLTDDSFVFTGTRAEDRSAPYSPNAVTQRYKDMAARLGIDTHLHALRHYSATELLTAGIDLRTVSGRLGHGGGGATTLRVYAAWVPASDQKAAEILGSRMPKRRKQQPDTDPQQLD